MTEDVVISTRDLTRHFRVGGGFLGGPARVVRAVDGVTLDIRARETFALVGESGCGKTTLGRVMLRLQEPTSGTVAYRGTDLTGLDEGAMNALRKKLQIVFQDPYASLNPRMRVGEILAEPLRSHGCGSSAEIRERSAELLEMVGLRRQYLRNYPHQFSGGQRQRIGI
ncbi:MAG: ABC transporter ATP-binding protein, partial [Caldilinea sp.]|nr:ABC transporter ATP-binding protein [Caldilinea sp.]